MACGASRIVVNSTMDINEDQRAGESSVMDVTTNAMEDMDIIEDQASALDVSKHDRKRPAVDVIEDPDVATNTMDKHKHICKRPGEAKVSQ